MSRSFIYLRRALFGVSCAIVFGFGANQALAAAMPDTDYGACEYGDPGSTWYCTNFCQMEGLGQRGICTTVNGGRCGCY